MPFISTLRCSSHSSTRSDTGTGLFRGTCGLPDGALVCRQWHGGVRDAAEGPQSNIHS